jgi:hypothetical protein
LTVQNISLFEEGGIFTGPVREAEVQEHGIALGQDTDIVGLDIAMNEAGAVQGGQHLGCLPRDPQGCTRIEAVIAAQAAAQRFTRQQVHDQEIRRPGHMGPSQFHQMRMPNRQTGPCFPLQKFDGRRLVGPVRPQNLDRARGIGGQRARGIHRGQHAAAQAGQQFVTRYFGKRLHSLESGRIGFHQEDRQTGGKNFSSFSPG